MATIVSIAAYSPFCTINRPADVLCNKARFVPRPLPLIKTVQLSAFTKLRSGVPELCTKIPFKLAEVFELIELSMVMEVLLMEAVNVVVPGKKTAVTVAAFRSEKI